MVGVDVSLRPWSCAAQGNGRWAFGHLPEGRNPAQALREALASSHGRDRAVALCIPARSVVWDTIPGLRLRSRHARKAAILAAATRLRITPREAAVSLDEAQEGVMYACAERAAIEAAMAPWLAAGFTVPVVEPAAVSLLRGIGSEASVVVVRAGAGEVEIVAGSRDRLLFARHLPVAWESGRVSAVRLEVDATIEAARKEGVAIERVLVSGHGDLDALLGAFSNAAVATASPEHQLPEAPTWAIAAVSAALWRAGAPKAKRAAHLAYAGASLGRVFRKIGAHRSAKAKTDA